MSKFTIYHNKNKKGLHKIKKKNLIIISLSKKKATDRKLDYYLLAMLLFLSLLTRELPTILVPPFPGKSLLS